MRERERQVELMTKVYSLAIRVFADLGEEADDSAQALALIDAAWKRHAKSRVQALERNLSYKDSRIYLGLELPYQDPSGPLQHFILPNWDSPAWLSITRLLSRPWFLRIWIIQEFVLAREVIFFIGEKALNWRALFAGFHVYEDGMPLKLATKTVASSCAAKAFCTIGTLRRIRELNRTPHGRRLLHSMGLPYFDRDGFLFRGPSLPHLEQMRFIEILNFFRDSRCSQKHDRYYALKGIASDVTGGEKELKPDYESPIETIILRLGKFLLSHVPTYRILRRLGLWQVQRTAVPSWAPDFARANNRADVTNDPWGGLGRWHRACGDVGGEFATTTFGERAHTIVDPIDKAPFQSPLKDSDLTDQWDSRNAYLGHIALSMRAMFTDAGDGLSSTLVYKPTGESLFDAECLTLTVGCDKKGANSRQTFLVGFHVDSWRAVAEQSSEGVYSRFRKRFGNMTTDEVYRDVIQFEWRVRDSIPLYRMQVSRTRRGYLVNIPSCILPGDQIWVMRGI
ncbi:hypothetical protein QBC38DRAFT_218359 [Podospora fimiseda]|uniref:Heterokaryon incompatibility domain-containing protein n=1 Tax=Podospora fimiseda TaxID=252190 RepID=A0AAN7BPG1_9PEZI|nr:hypothetical protein QBC38DRAFT_218359 [Podospora fimiseda]